MQDLHPICEQEELEEGPYLTSMEVSRRMEEVDSPRDYSNKFKMLPDTLRLVSSRENSNSPNGSFKR